MKAPIHVGEKSSTQEPSLEEEKALIWKSHVMIPFTISDNVHVFMRLLPDSFVESKKVKELFPCYHHSKACVSLDIPYEMGFMSSHIRVCRDVPYVNQNAYFEWINKVEAKGLRFGNIWGCMSST